MIVVRDFDRLKGKELVATIGFFDGVHLGHRFLIDEMKEIAKARNLPERIEGMLLQIYNDLNAIENGQQKLAFCLGGGLFGTFVS